MLRFKQANDIFPVGGDPITIENFNQSKTPCKLINLLESNREEICAIWVDTIQQLPLSAVWGKPGENLHGKSLEILDAFTESLKTGSPARLENYLDQMAATIFDGGLGINDVIDGVFLVKTSVMALLRSKLEPGSALMLSACFQLDGALRDTVSYLARRWAAMTNQKMLERQEQTAALLEVLKAVTSTLELNEVLRRVADAINAVVGTPLCGFCLVDEKRGLLVPQNIAVVNPFNSNEWLTKTTPPQPVSSLNEFERHVLEQKEPVICLDAQNDPRVNQDWMRSHGIKSILAVPFVVKNKVVAIAFAYTLDKMRGFSREQVDLAVGIANAVALSIENARLYQETKSMAVMEERDRLGREMHDNLAQSIGALQLKASQAAAYLDHGRNQKARNNLAELEDMISATHKDVRENIFNMRTMAAPGKDFIPALQEYLKVYSESYDVSVRIDLQNQKELEWDKNTSFQTLRIVQEALTNVRKHACTEQAAIIIRSNEEFVTISITDHGRGFDSAKMMGRGGHHLGLQVMNERAESIGGKLEVESNPGQGTTITLSLSHLLTRGTP